MHRLSTSHRNILVAGSLLGSLILTTACAAPEQAPASTATAFEGARLITGDGSDPIENATFVVDGGQFVAVGATGEVSVPDGAERVDLTGQTVIPAIIDAHTHLSRERAALVQDLQHRAYYGVGVVTSLGQDEGSLPFEVRAETIPNAARFTTAGRGITAPEPGRSEIPYWVTSEEEARAAIVELSDPAVDLVKLWVDDRNGMYDKLAPELYGAAIDEAHQRGLRVTAHIFTLEDAKGLLRAGLDAFAHGVRDQDIDEEGLALFTERPNVVLVPNLPGRGVAVDLGWLSETVPAERLQELQEAAVDNPEAQEGFALQARNLATLSAAGVRVALGTDGNTPWGAHLEMEDMVAAGMTPAQVLVAATRNGAELLRMDDVGTVAVGKSADFVALEANPLDDITNTRRIAEVYLRGESVDRAALSEGLRGEASE